MPLLITCQYPSYLTLYSCFAFVLLLLLILYLLILDFYHFSLKYVKIHERHLMFASFPYFHRPCNHHV